MLSARHMTLDELATQSAHSREKCRRFLLDLCRAGYARPLDPGEEKALLSSRARPGVPEKNRLKSLFSRIRVSLGFHGTDEKTRSNTR
jgi:hypothetical protein